MQRLKEIIENFDQIELQDVDVLKQYAHQHPYSAIVQLAYAYFLHKQENYNFNTQLKLTAAVINSRTKLFNIIHGSNLAKVLKYHQAPVYVQEFDKIDDLRNEKIQNEKETNTTESIFQNRKEPLVIKSEKPLNEKVEKNLLNNQNTDDNPQIPTNFSEKEREESLSVANQNIQHFEINEHKSINTETLESKEIIGSNPKTEVKEKQTTSESNLEAIREKIRAKFGLPISEDSSKEEKEKILPDNLKTVSDNPNQVLPDSRPIKEENKIPLFENSNTKEENDQQLKKDNFKKSLSKEESDNEKLNEVKNRASNILKKLEDLKAKYGSLVPRSNEDKSESDEISKSLEEQNPIELTNEKYPNTSQNLEDESEVEFDLTDIQVEENIIINDDSNTADSTHLVVSFGEVNINEDNTEQKQINFHSDSTDDTQIHSVDETVLLNNDSTTSLEINFENDKLYTNEVKKSSSEKEVSVINVSDESNDDEDIFSKWLKTLHKSEENSNKENDFNDTLSPQKSIETNSNSATNKKIEKLKIIDNFLSGNIQIKPKSPNTKAVEEQKDLSIKYTETTPDLMTETLAELYIAQGHVDKAIQALEILKLKNPEKSSYFARRIQELKKKK